MRSETKNFLHFKNESLTRIEASEYLGVKKSFLDINATINRYQIPFYKIGKQTRYLKEDLDKFIESCRVNGEFL